MLDTLRRLDQRWVRFEGWLTVLVLILMVFVAGFAAGVRNLTRFDVAWANALLNDMDWADSLLRKGTMWLAFLGASMATYHRKHINIDMLLRIAPPRLKFGMLAVGTTIASLLTVGLVISFSAAVYLNLTERPVEYELLGPDGRSMHICDATPEQLKEIDGLERPPFFCMSRSALALLSVPAETPGAAFQLIVPIMLVMMALRLFAQGMSYVGILLGGPEALHRAELEEKAMLAAQQAVPEALRESVAEIERGER
jgi:TRAP-type C4-dicarboxylate transport system permease small subunit